MSCNLYRYSFLTPFITSCHWPLYKSSYHSPIIYISPSHPFCYFSRSNTYVREVVLPFVFLLLKFFTRAFCHLSHACCISNPPHASWFQYPDNRDIWWRVQIVQFLVIQYSAGSSSTISRTSLLLSMTNHQYNHSKNLRPNLHGEGLLPLDCNNRVLLLISVLYQ